MNRFAAAVVVAACSTMLAGCGGDPAPLRVQMVADACSFPVDEVPVEEEWTIGTYAQTPTMEVDLPDGQAATIEMTDGTTVDNLDENLRIEGVTCWIADHDDDEDYESTVSWSPNGKAYTLDTEKIYSKEDLEQAVDADSPASDAPDAEQPTDTSDEAAESVEVEDTDATVTNVLGGFTAADIEEYVTTNLDSQDSVDLSTFECGSINEPFFDGDVATCVVETNTGPITLLATVTEGADGVMHIGLDMH